MFKRIISSIMALAVCLTLTTLTAFADEDSSSQITSDTTNNSTTDQEEFPDLSDIFGNTDWFLSNGWLSDYDYYGDSYYDTDGNATLIESKKLYGADTMQFIAVTTKDGSVFYILIKYDDYDEVDNVYFLNKVDDYDLYALLYNDSDSSNGDPHEAAQSAADKANSKNDDSSNADANDDSDASSDDDSSQSSSGSMGASILNNPYTLYAVGGIFVVIVFVVMIKTKKPKKNTQSTAAEYDYDEDDDIEINEEDE